ncbi:hypothetical protein MPH_05335 [Macrophomina phaseolina MS6]|uniref:Uncharacterized protein n=1 Tax=Macrophomina phaseolina (strain MS6) TaxID=1126212 RepID=K2S4D2_MACPH|nr:hypothetical protein MPH_05335 [Macrophomina phaseolina MS6]
MTSARDADAAAAAGGPLSHLRVSLHQSSTSPATIIARVTNDDPSTAYTLVAWDTPLDPLAIKLGLATLTLPSTGEVLSLPIIQIRRKLPPDAASIITIEPGKSAEQQFVLEEPVVPVERIRAEGGGRVSVQFKGWWASVWAVEGGEPVAKEGPDEARLSGEFASEVLEVTV